MTLVVFIASFSLSFSSIAGMAALMGVPDVPILRAMAPVAVDASLVVFSAVGLVRKGRHQTLGWTRAAEAFWTLVSMAANALHVLLPAPHVDSGTIVGAALSSLMPLAVLGSVRALQNLLVYEGPAEIAASHGAYAASLEHVTVTAVLPGEGQDLAKATETLQYPQELDVPAHTREAGEGRYRSSIEAMSSSGATPPRGRAKGPTAEMSVTELDSEVQRLVALNRSQRQIAEELSISRAAVQRAIARTAPITSVA